MTTTYVNLEIDGKTENKRIENYFQYINCRGTRRQATGEYDKA